MSRSKRKNKIFPTTTSESEKKEKRINNRMFRRRESMFLNSGFFEKLPYSMNEVSDPWGMSKDGKRYRKNATKKDLRK